MANITKLVFSTDSVALDEPVIVDGRITGTATVDKPRSEVETTMLKDLAEYSANTAKSMKDVISMLNVVEQLEKLTGAITKNTEVDLANADILKINEAFVGLQNKPNGWIRYCRNLIRQLASVKE